jgi:dipeptidyl aminopeptidase/acylaminoacyl peptidase
MTTDSLKVKGMEKFEVKNPSGQRIVGIIDKPKGKPPFETLIFCHGFKGFKEQKYIEYIANFLSKRGICVVRFDSTNGIGESGGDIFDVTAGHYLEDLEMVFNWVKNQNFVKKKALSIGGASFGGMVAVLFAAKSPPIKSLILQSPAFKPKELHKDVDLKKWQKQGYLIFHSHSKNIDVRVGYQFYAEGLKYDMEEAAARIKVPTLIIHGTKDTSVPLRQSKDLIEVLQVPKKLFLIKDAPNTVEDETHLVQYAQKIESWIKEL